MFVCLECRGLFQEPLSWSENHGLDTPPYEEFKGSPCCYAGYINADPCNCCGHAITTDNYITVDGNKYCSDCYTVHDLGDGDL